MIRQSLTGAAPNGLLAGYAMPIACPWWVQEPLDRKIRRFFLPFSNLPGWISSRKITPLIFRRSTKFTGPGAAIFLE